MVVGYHSIAGQRPCRQQLRKASGRAGRWLLVLAGLLWASAGHAQSRLRYEGWQVEWQEEFEEPATTDSTGLAQRWHFSYPWGRNLLPNLETQFYTADQVRPGWGGTLRLGARKLAQPRPYRGKALRYEAGMLYSNHPSDSLSPERCPAGNGFSYGLFEVRCRQPASSAAFPAFWLFGGVPDEIDIFEGVRWGISNNVLLNPNAYWRPFGPGSQTCQCLFPNANPTADLHQDFHTYSLSWLPGELIFYFDGFPIRRETRYVPLGCPMALILNLAMLNWAEIPQDSLLVDYVRVYRPAPGQRQQPGTIAPNPVLLSEMQYLPRLAPPGPDPDLSPQQRWELRPDTTSPLPELELELIENRNPTCNSSTPLPWSGHWTPPFRILSGEPQILIAMADSLPLTWTLTTACGVVRQHGTVPAGTIWRPDWATLEPGSYCIALQVGPATRRQALQVLARPSGSRPTSDWLASPAAEGAAPSVARP